MAEMNPTGAGRQVPPGAPTPAIRTSSLQSASGSQPHTSRASQQHQQQPQQQQQPQHPHFQPQVNVAGAATQSQNPQVGNQQIFTSTGLLSGPRLVVLHRHNGDFGFTLRHFIVYPPPEATTDPQTGRLAAAAGMPNFAQPMDTVFVKKVHPNSPAFLAGLQEGDRLLAVNGISVTSIPYAQVVATIQQTPKTLTLQVVPKNYDLLQTYFSETAYNPETNQRPQPQQLFIPKTCSTPNSRIGGGGVKRVLADVQEKQESLYSTLQEIVENVAAPAPMVAAANNNNKAIYAEVPKIRSPPVAVEAPPAVPMVGLQQHQPQQQQQRTKPVVFDFDPIKQQHYLAQQQQQQHHQQQLHQQQQQQQKLLQHGKDNDSISSYDSVKSGATLSANDILMFGGDSAIMSRLRKSFEQKEEFLRRPAPVPQSASFDVQQREFYGRPNRLQKSVWPPPPAPQQQQQQQQPQQQHHQTTTMPVINTAELESLAKPSKMSSGTQTTSIPTKPAPIATTNNNNSLAVSREQHTSHLSAIREQFFSGVNGLSYQQQQQQPQQYQPQQQQQQQQHQDDVWAPPRSAPPSLAVQKEQLQQNQLSGSQSALPLSPHSMHVVSEKAKLFESGRPLSPDGIDRAELYKSELSRINTKQVVPNVAVRRKEFELKAESSGWRRSTEEKARSVSSDSESRRTPVRVRSLSVESTTVRDPSALYTSSDTHQQMVVTNEGVGGPPPGPCTLLRQRPVRENSYRNAVRNSTAFWLQGPATSGAFVPPPSALSPPPSAPPTNGHHSAFSFVSSRSPPPSSSPFAPVPPARTYPAVHRLQPLSEEQFKLRMLHRNQTIVEVHNQPPSSQYATTTAGDTSSDEGGGDGDVDMKLAPPYSISPTTQHFLHAPSGCTSTGTSTAVASAVSAIGHGTSIAASTTSSSTAPTAAPSRPTTLSLCADSGPVVLRQKQQQSSSQHAIEEDERKTRRISYLRATAHDNLFQMESDPSDSSPMSLQPDTPDTEPEPIDQQRRGDGGGDNPLSQQPHQLRSHQQQLPQQLKSHGAKSKALAHFRDSPADPAAAIVREGELNVKVTLIDGKRSQDRSWRTVHAELRGNRLKLTLLRDGKSSSNQSPEPSGIIDLTNFHVAEGNYTKRKNVFKLTTVSYQPSSAQSHQHLAVHQTQSGGGGGGHQQQHAISASGGATSLYKGYERELLLQADSQHDMRLWMDSLKTVCRSSQYSNSIDYINNLGGQQAEPQRVAALTSVQSTSNDEFSPILSTKSHGKYTLGSRSPSGQSPVTKSRKTPQQNSAAVPTPSVATGNHHHTHHSGKESSDKETGSPKSKTWKGIVARQFRKMQGQPGSPGIQNQEMHLPDGASINVPLQLCPPSDENPYVPLLLAKCTGIVESKGLGVVGIYRIPGNTAAISQLTEQVNRGMDEVTLRDPRWDDVNVVSSLLKSFIRNLPDPLLPNEMYHNFIQADKLSGQQRLIELKQLLNKIPTYNHETLKHLMRHLYAVSTNALVNLMDPRNLAIVFGPSVVRSANESLETAVKDMKHQCQIVEVLINHYQYFFEDDLLPNVAEKASSTTVDSGLDAPSTNLLLDNVSKIEPFKESSKESSSHFVAQIVQAANRKIRRTTQRKSTMSSTTPDTLSLDSTTSAESKEQSSRTSHRYLHPNSATLGASGGVGAGAPAANTSPQLVDHHQGGLSGSPGGPVHSDDSQKENLVHHHHYHHYHHHLGSGNRHHSAQSADDNSSVLNRSSEEDSNDSAFADNGSMSLKTVTLTLDHKLRSLRNSSIDSDRDVADTTLESDCDNSSSCYSATAASGTPTRRSVHHSRPLTLGENIPYADESPERPLIQSRSKPLRQLSNTNGNFPKSSDLSNSNSSLFNNNTSSVGSSPTSGVLNGSVKSAHSDKSIDSSGGGGGMTTTTTTPANSSGATNDSCVTLVNEEEDDEEDKVNNISLSSDDTDTSTTSNPREKLTAATYRIDTEVLKKMNRILTNLERKANNLERKFNLNRSLSLNYKNHKNLECCCGHAVANSGPGGGATIPTQCCNNNNNMHNQQNNNNSVSVHNSLNVRSRLSLTKDEKTDKNINRRRQIHDISQTAPVSGEGGCCGEHHPHHVASQQGPQIILTPTANPQTNGGGVGGRHRRQVGSRSIRRRHTVGGTHDYCSNKIVNNHGHNGVQCQQQHQQHAAGGRGVTGCTAVVQQGVCGGEEK